MKKLFKFIISSLLIISLFSISLMAGAVVVDFRGESGENKVILKWSTLSESNCNGFQVERSLNQTEFTKIGFVEGARTASSTKKEYQYIDKTVFKTQVNRTFYYRLKLINSDNTNTVFSQVVAVTPSISGARYTWGSIKAMFR